MDLITPEKQAILHKIKYFYGLNESSGELIKEFFSREENKIWDLQQALVEYVLWDKTFLSFQPYRKYRRTFLKTIIEIVEKLNEEVNETILEDYITLINQVQTSDEEKYFLVVLSKEKNSVELDSRPIIIEQFATIISNGTTGLHVWPACYQLVDFLKANTHLFKDKAILELGCGLGLLGLNCLQLCMPRSYIFTDSHEKVLSQLKTNILYNYPDTNETNKISVVRLDWNELEDCELLSENNETNFDVILASDIIFDPDLMPSLANTLDCLWKRNSNKNLVLYISSTIRNEATYNAFLTNLGARNLKHECVVSNTCNLRNSCNSTPNSKIELLKVFK